MCTRALTTNTATADTTPGSAKLPKGMTDSFRGSLRPILPRRRWTWRVPGSFSVSREEIAGPVRGRPAVHGRVRPGRLPGRKRAAVQGRIMSMRLTFEKFQGPRFRAMSMALALAGACLACASPLLAAPSAPFGQITTFATVPPVPGFPEGVAVHGNRVFASGPARFGTAGTGPSAIQVYDRNTGALVQTISVAGEALAFEHAVSNIAIDGDGRIYALSTQLGLIRFTKQGQGYVQDSYGAPLPDLPAC